MGGAGGMSGSVAMDGAALDPRMEPGAGGSVGSNPEDLPGGDTSDLGAAGQRSCAGNSTAKRSVSLEEARSTGFDVDSLREEIEGVFEAEVRWDQSFDHPETTVRVEITAEGTAAIAEWDCAEPRSCYAVDVLGLGVRVAIATEDGRLRAEYDSSVSTAPAYGLFPVLFPGTHRQNGTESVTIVSNRYGTVAALIPAADGTLPFGFTDPNAVVWLTVQTEPGRDPRIRVILVESARTVRALPADGCDGWKRFYAPDEAVPQPSDRAEVSCSPAPLSAGNCCGIRSAQSYPITAGTNLACTAEDDGGVAVPDDDAGL